MLQAIGALWRALRLWWRDPYTFILLNLGWLILQIPLITGPAATAALYVAAHKAVSDEYLNLREVMEEMRHLFWPALGWGLLNAVVLGAVAGNLWAYRAASGLLWLGLRTLWISIGITWFAINTFFWPFWLEQEHPTLRSTFLNGLLILIKRPVYALEVVVITLAIMLVSTVLTLPLGAIMMSWVALLGVVAVDEELKPMRAARSTATPGEEKA